jgi:hypothetical protein
MALGNPLKPPSLTRTFIDEVSPDGHALTTFLFFYKNLSTQFD